MSEISYGGTQEKCLLVVRVLYMFSMLYYLYTAQVHPCANNQVKPCVKYSRTLRQIFMKLV